MSDLNIELAFASLLGDCKKQGLLKKTKEDGYNNTTRVVTRAVVSDRVFKPTALVLIKHTYICKCGSCYEAPNPRLLKETVNGKGEVIMESKYLPSDIKELTRRIDEMVHEVDVCFECLASAELDFTPEELSPERKHPSLEDLK